ncbi:hypothetical protein [Glutamicibacter sp. V16R2B1]|uniref:hypothetical protein n=1 Tax=Glutamicibacter sp. V16R2B1 TaxID=2036207 RepID=UPI0010FE5387|nr:hypothetical protein [Glutamicibacter sp. V16R2B1]MCK9901282.1 hypothetical protein [Frankia sp. Cpl3]TLK47468.1 hypothetical protein FDN03_15790 [Glutamicibacter sp. V16R2B1]
MTRLPFPQDRTAYAPGGGIFRAVPVGAAVEIRLDTNPGELPPIPGDPADVRRHDGTEGPIIVDSVSQMAPWLGPDQVDPDKTLLVRVNGGVWWRVEACLAPRVDGLDARLVDVEENGGGGGGSVPTSRTITAGTGMTGGGDLTANRTIAANIGTTTGTVAAGDDSRITGATPTSRTITAGTGLTGGGSLAADRTLAVTYGTTSGTAAQGNDSRIVGAEQAANKGEPDGYAELDGSGLVPAAQLPIGTSAGTVAAGNDSRIADTTTAINAVDDRVDQCIAVVYHTGSAWPDRPTGFESVEWRGPDASRPTIGGTGARDGYDTFLPIS